ncbi:MAG: ATP-binding protein [Myxococcales bacterium]|nr:ATP-binding protein [Myxococcales bacterium]
MNAPSSQQANAKRIDASPTKEFFIYMLTRDIPLARAILDLVDNAIDGARKLRPDGDFSGLWVRVEVSSDHFKISDNCGGIPVEVARTYAFRFGRPRGAPITPGSVGQFGVGMKRTFFKLGRHFTVVSTTRSSRFDMDVDVEAWLTEHRAKADDKAATELGGQASAAAEDPTAGWHFEFKNVEDDLAVSEDEVGTSIVIDQLYETVSENFKLDSFITRLKQDTSLAHSLSIDKGLAISVNGIPLRHDPQTLFVSETLKPGFVEKRYSGSNGRPGVVVVKLYVGVAQREFHEGGWYIFCNGRMVLRADQTATTIWGDTHGLRQYHADFAYFRGYAYFDSDDAALLPWTTTKTGVDVDYPIYRTVQQEMVELSKPVLAFLTNLAKEKGAAEAGDQADGALDLAIRSGKATRTDAISAASFAAPQPRPAPAGPRMQKIQYSRPADQVAKVRQLLKANTFAAVGEMTFDYYLKYEGEE